MGTSKSIKKKSEEAFKLTKEIKQLEKNTVYSILGVGQRLKRIKEEKLYGYYGVENFRDYLNLDEVQMKPRTANYYIAVYENFGHLEDALETSYRRLTKLLPVVNENNKEELVEKAKYFPEEDFNSEIKKVKGEVSPSDCVHSETEKITITKCKHCKKVLSYEKGN